MTDLTSTIEDGIEQSLPLIALLIRAVPALSPLAPFITLLPTVIDAVKHVQATGVSSAAAVNAVQAHLIPGAPNAPALSG